MLLATPCLPIRRDLDANCFPHDQAEQKACGLVICHGAAWRSTGALTALMHWKELWRIVLPLQVTCKAAKLDALKAKVAEEISKSWAEHRASGWADPVPAAKRSEADIESDYGNNFFLCVMDVPVDV